MKLHIVGIPSAGKTTLATDLSDRMGTPYFVLDGLAFVDDKWTLRSPSERDEMLAEILGRPAFITEGGFLDWTGELLASADLIIWLDPPLRTLMWRHVLRFRRHPLSLPSLLMFQIRSYLRPAGVGPFKGDPNLTRSGIGTALKPWRDKVLRVRRSAHADEIVAYVDASATTEVRRVQPDEWELFKAVRLAALADAPHAFGSTFERERGLSEDGWRERVAAAARFIAFRFEQPVGLVGAWMEPTGEVELVSMWVAPAARHSGVGRALIDAVVHHARLHGSRSVLLWVADSNEAAERLYETRGFARTGRVQPVDETTPLVASSFRCVLPSPDGSGVHRSESA